MEFNAYRDTQRVNLQWSARPAFAPSAALLSWVPMASSSTQVILEIGCCDGKTLPLLWRKGYHTVGLELFQELAEKTRPYWKTSSLQVVTGDGHMLPFADRSVDVILADNGFEHFWNVGQALREVARVLKRPGALFTAAPLAATRLSSAHLWEVFSPGAMVAYLSASVPEARLVRMDEMIDGPEHQILMHFRWE